MLWFLRDDGRVWNFLIYTKIISIKSNHMNQGKVDLVLFHSNVRENHHDESSNWLNKSNVRNDIRWFPRIDTKLKYIHVGISHFQSDFIKMSGEKNVGADLRNYVCNFRNLLKTVHSLFDATDRHIAHKQMRHGCCVFNLCRSLHIQTAL